jgi:hypothetical protein
MRGSERRGRQTLIAAVILAICAGVAGVVLSRSEETGEPVNPNVDTSADLEDVPLGCAVFGEEEVAPYIAGRIEVEDRGGEESPALDTTSCQWRGDSTEPKVTVSTMVYHASGRRSGVDLARQFFENESMTPRMVELDVAHSNEAMFFQVNEISAYVFVRRHNVLYKVVQNGGEPTPDLRRNLEELAAIAIGKVGD